MNPPSPASYPDNMTAFLTTEHSTLQSARSIINAEITSRINIYFALLSSVLIASAFLAQLPQIADVFNLFIWIAFPVLILLGLFTLARLMVLGRMDFVYLHAINRVRQFYVRAAPETQSFLLFPPYDDDRSALLYGGYSLGFRGNLLSSPHAVIVTNSIVTTVLLSALLIRVLQLSTASFLPFGIVLLVVVYLLHGFLGFTLARVDLHPEYRDVRFPPPPGGSRPS